MITIPCYCLGFVVLNVANRVSGIEPLPTDYILPTVSVPTQTKVASVTPKSIATATLGPTVITSTYTATVTKTRFLTPTSTLTLTNTPTLTPTATLTATSTSTQTKTSTATPTKLPLVITTPDPTEEIEPTTDTGEGS